MTDTTDYFAKLEEKLGKAVETFKQMRAEKRALEQELQRVKAESADRSKRWDSMERELEGLRNEREEVRARVERLLGQIDALTKLDSAG